MSALGTVLIGGGTGFIGTHLQTRLFKLGYAVKLVSRKPKLLSITWSELAKQGLPSDCVAIVNVAGQNVMDPTRRWTPSFKQSVITSRINTNRTLAEAIKRSANPPEVFVTISGVGYYPPSPSVEYTEESSVDPHQTEFLFNLCKDWEDAGDLSPLQTTRRVIIRSGVVLGKDGGIVKQMYWPFYLGMGGHIGSGQQFMPWIHIDDIVELFIAAIRDQSIEGVLNGVAPQVVTNAEFTKAFSGALWRPALFPVPTPLVNLAFSSERAIMITEGQRVIPKKALEFGFEFKYPDIESACKQCVT